MWKIEELLQASKLHFDTVRICILHTLLWSGNICASVYRGRNRKQRTKQLQKQCSLIPKLFHYVEQQVNRRKKKNNLAGL